MRKIGKNWVENNLAELLVLMGGALSYYETHNDLEGYKQEYFNKKDGDGYHYRMQKLADKKIISELKIKGVRCQRWRVKRFYRYKTNRKVKVDKVLYDYFQYVMDYILAEEVLTDLMFEFILKKCKCQGKIGQCLYKLLGYVFEYVNERGTAILKNEIVAEKLLDKLKGYPAFEVFRTACKQSPHTVGIVSK